MISLGGASFSTPFLALEPDGGFAPVAPPPPTISALPTVTAPPQPQFQINTIGLGLTKINIGSGYWLTINEVAGNLLLENSVTNFKTTITAAAKVSTSQAAQAPFSQAVAPSTLSIVTPTVPPIVAPLIVAPPSVQGEMPPVDGLPLLTLPVAAPSQSLSLPPSSNTDGQLAVPLLAEPSTIISPLTGAATPAPPAVVPLEVPTVAAQTIGPASAELPSVPEVVSVPVQADISPLPSASPVVANDPVESAPLVTAVANDAVPVPDVANPAFSTATAAASAPVLDPAPTGQQSTPELVVPNLNPSLLTDEIAPMADLEPIPSPVLLETSPINEVQAPPLANEHLAPPAEPVNWFQFWGTTSFAFGDDGMITLQTKPVGDALGSYMLDTVTVTNGDRGVVITGVADEGVGNVKFDQSTPGVDLEDAVRDGLCIIENPQGNGWIGADDEVFDQQLLDQTAVGGDYAPGSDCLSAPEVRKVVMMSISNMQMSLQMGFVVSKTISDLSEGMRDNTHSTERRRGEQVLLDHVLAQRHAELNMYPNRF
jgi:hypothetical protein